MHYYVIDVETTGTDAKLNEITEVSIIRCADRVQKTWMLRIEYPDRCHPKALAVTGKTRRELVNRKLHLSDVIKDINAFLEEDGGKTDERVMIAHNAPFDRRFCETWWKKLGYTFPADLWECTMKMSKKHIKIADGETKPKAKLIDLIQRFKIKGETKFHGSSPDTRNTYRLRDYLLKQGTIKEIEFIEISKEAVERKAPIKASAISADEVDDETMQELFGFDAGEEEEDNDRL